MSAWETIERAAERLCRERLRTVEGLEALNHRGIGACGECVDDAREAHYAARADRPGINNLNRGAR